MVLFHLFVETFGVRFPVMHNAWSYFLLNGSLAVSIFFVLSGDALSAGFFQSRSVGSIDRLVVKRYPRLTVPILCASLLSLALMHAHLNYNVEAGTAVGSTWLAQFLPFEPDLHATLGYAFIYVYTERFPKIAYNPFLWTMSYELAGSLLIFLFLYLHDSLRAPSRVLLGLIAILYAIKCQYCGFFIGAWFGHLRATGVLARVRARPGWSTLALLLLVALGLLDTLLRNTALGAIPPWDSASFVNTAIAAGVVWCCYTSDHLSRFLGNRFSQLLGRLSFPLYLCQFSVIVSLTSFLILKATAQNALTIKVAAGIAVLSLAAVFALSAIFLFIERWTISGTNAMATALLKARPAHPANSGSI